jgi:serine/threonine protein kinase
MEYIQGKNIYQVIHELRSLGKFPPIEVACSLFLQALDGLDRAHRQCDHLGKPLNIIHRDLSPANIMISYDGEAKITDFGIAKAADTKICTVEGTVKGKVRYMSPEQARGEEIDQRSDVFSLGICFYELITLHGMFTDASDYEILRRVRQAEFARPGRLNPAIPEKLERILLRALTRDPADRYQSAGEWGEALTGFVEEEGIHFQGNSLLAPFMQETYGPVIERENLQIAEEAEAMERMFPEDPGRDPNEIPDLAEPEPVSLTTEPHKLVFDDEDTDEITAREPNPLGPEEEVTDRRRLKSTRKEIPLSLRRTKQVVPRFTEEENGEDDEQ